MPGPDAPQPPPSLACLLLDSVTIAADGLTLLPPVVTWQNSSGANLVVACAWEKLKLDQKTGDC